MGDKMISAADVIKATRIDGERLNRLIEDAESAFWARLARDVPEARSGDLGPEHAQTFTAACREAVKAWLIANVHPVQTTGSCSVRVELRRPRKGERAWWVKDDSTPEAALREVLRESEELGFEAPMDADHDYDEEGMRLVTVLVRNRPAAATESPEESWDKLKDLP